MEKTKINEKMVKILENKIDDVDIARIKSIIGNKDYRYTVIDEEWIEKQFVGNETEYVHPKYGTVLINVELSILDVIGNNALIENKRIYTGKYSEDVHEIIIYFFGPIDKEILKDAFQNT